MAARTSSLVSNCAEHTRDQLSRTGLAGLADVLVLSCEVGYSKPAAQIYERALSALGVAPAEAVFIDDQPAYCAAAAALSPGCSPTRFPERGHLEPKKTRKVMFGFFRA